MSISFEDFIKELNKGRLILLGELHGTKEIPEIVKQIIINLGDKLGLVFLEIPEDQQKYINQYIMSKDEKDLFNIPFFRNPTKDGRDSKENLLLIKCILEPINKIKIIFVDPNKIKDREYLMYRNIKEKLKSQSNLSIFLTGNVHASKEEITINEKRISTCGYYLKKWLGKNLISVNFVANKGSFYNLKVKQIFEKNKKEGIFRSKTKDYDFEYRLKELTPCHFLPDNPQ